MAVVVMMKRPVVKLCPVIMMMEVLVAMTV